MVRGEGDFVPDPQHFGILYVKADYARDVLDFQDACNQMVGRLVPGAEATSSCCLIGSAACWTLTACWRRRRAIGRHRIGSSRTKSKGSASRP